MRIGGRKVIAETKRWWRNNVATIGRERMESVGRCVRHMRKLIRGRLERKAKMRHERVRIRRGYRRSIGYGISTTDGIRGSWKRGTIYIQSQRVGNSLGFLLATLHLPENNNQFNIVSRLFI